VDVGSLLKGWGKTESPPAAAAVSFFVREVWPVNLRLRLRVGRAVAAAASLGALRVSIQQWWDNQQDWKNAASLLKAGKSRRAALQSLAH
jgi:hypothetical protein